MRNNAFLPIGLVFALVMAVLVVGFKISATPAWSASDPIQQNINRTLKGNRSPLVPARTSNTVNWPREINDPNEPVTVSELIEGCEPVVSSIGAPPLALVAGSCQT